jgi:hypothetical protein
MFEALSALHWQGLPDEAPRPLVFPRPDFGRKSAPDRLNMVTPADHSSPRVEAASGRARLQHYCSGCILTEKHKSIVHRF